MGCLDGVAAPLAWLAVALAASAASATRKKAIIWRRHQTMWADNINNKKRATIIWRGGNWL